MFSFSMMVHVAYNQTNTFFDTVTALTPLLRERGYRKTHYTWHKHTQGLTLLFSVIRNSPDSENWKYAFGIGIDGLSQHKITQVQHCHLKQTFGRSRYGLDWTVNELMEALDYWEQRYGSLRALNTSAIRKALPPDTPQNIIHHCTWIDYSEM